MYPNYCCSKSSCYSNNCCSTPCTPCTPCAPCVPCTPTPTCCPVPQCCEPRRRVPPLASTLIGIASSGKRKGPLKKKASKCGSKKSKKECLVKVDNMLADQASTRSITKSCMSCASKTKSQQKLHTDFQLSRECSMRSIKSCHSTCSKSRSMLDLENQSVHSAKPNSGKTSARQSDETELTRDDRSLLPSEGKSTQSSRRNTPVDDSSRKTSLDPGSVRNSDGNKSEKRTGSGGSTSVARSARIQSDDITDLESLLSLRDASQKQLKNKKNFEYQDMNVRRPMEAIAEEEEDCPSTCPGEELCDGTAVSGKSIQETCADFLNIVNDSVLDTVQKSVECMLQQYFCQTMERIEGICAHMMRSDCMISKMYVDLMEKMCQQNEKSQIQFKCLCEFLIDSRKESTQSPFAKCFDTDFNKFSPCMPTPCAPSCAPPWAQNERNSDCCCPTSQNSSKRNSGESDCQNAFEKCFQSMKDYNKPSLCSGKDCMAPWGQKEGTGECFCPTSQNGSKRNSEECPSNRPSTSKRCSVERTSCCREQGGGYNRMPKNDASSMTDTSYIPNRSKYSPPLSQNDAESFTKDKTKLKQIENNGKERRSSSKELQKPHSDLQLRITVSKNFKPRNNRSDSSISIAN